MKTIIKQDREKFKVPRSVQETIPITVLHEDGVFQVGRNKFSKTFRFDDINYAVASDEDKDSMFKQYSRILNSYDSGVTVKLTINNRKFDRDDFVRHILISGRADGLDHFRKEYNTFLLKQTIGSNAVIQDRYITISTYKKDVEDARVYFARAAAELSANFSRLGSRCVELNALDRLRILYDFYHLGEKTRFQFNLKSSMRKFENLVSKLGCKTATLTIRKKSQFENLVSKLGCKTAIADEMHAYTFENLVSKLGCKTFCKLHESPFSFENLVSKLGCKTRQSQCIDRSTFENLVSKLGCKTPTSMH